LPIIAHCCPLLPIIAHCRPLLPIIAHYAQIINYKFIKVMPSLPSAENDGAAGFVGAA
jgi:hypothetical protein